MAEHKHGSMDITAQEKAFTGFLRFLAWGAGITIVTLIFTALINA